jgi:single-stranded-DNA-specific exonuclease
LIAGRVCERYYRPTFIGTYDESGSGKASARSIPGYSLFQAVRDTVNYHRGGGGHEMAAGLSFDLDQWEALAEALVAHAGARLTPELLAPRICCDFEVASGELAMKEILELQRLEPTGAGNRGLLLYARNLACTGERRSGDGQHVFPTLQFERGQAVKAKLFGMAEAWEPMCKGRLDVLFEPTLDEYNGRQELNWLVRALRRHES